MSEETVYKAQEAAKFNTHSSLPAYLLISAGAVLLLAYLFNIDLMEVLWPVFIIAPGLLLMWPAYKSNSERQSKFAFLALPGAMIVTSGVLLFAMNLTNHFEAWAYSWPLVIAAVAGGVLYVTRFDSNDNLQERTYKFIRVMFMMFIGMALFFEIVIFENFNPLMSLGLMAFGFYLLIRERKSAKPA